MTAQDGKIHEVKSNHSTTRNPSRFLSNSLFVNELKRIGKKLKGIPYNDWFIVLLFLLNYSALLIVGGILYLEFTVFVGIAFLLALFGVCILLYSHSRNEKQFYNRMLALQTASTVFLVISLPLTILLFLYFHTALVAIVPFAIGFPGTIAWSYVLRHPDLELDDREPLPSRPSSPSSRIRHSHAQRALNNPSHPNPLARTKSEPLHSTPTPLIQENNSLSITYLQREEVPKKNIPPYPMHIDKIIEIEDETSIQEDTHHALPPQTQEVIASLESAPSHTQTSSQLVSQITLRESKSFHPENGVLSSEHSSMGFFPSSHLSASIPYSSSNNPSKTKTPANSIAEDPLSSIELTTASPSPLINKDPISDSHTIITPGSQK